MSVSGLTPDGVPTVWTVNGNGFQSSLFIATVNDNNGSVSGTITDDNGKLDLVGANFRKDRNSKAKWDEVARLLTFSRLLPNGEFQTFTGFLFDRPGVPDYALAMAGTFIGAPFEDPRRPGFGWYALGNDAIAP